MRSSPRSHRAPIAVRREWPPQLNTDCSKVGVSILEQKETRIYCQQEPPQLCHGGGAFYPSIHFSVTASPALKVAGRLELIPAASGQGRVTAWTGRQVIEGHIKAHSHLRPIQSFQSASCAGLWTVAGRRRSWREPTLTQRHRKALGENQPPCRPGSYYV